MALIRTTVGDEAKRRADVAFARSGITTPMAARMLVAQVVCEDRTPFDNVFPRMDSVSLAEGVRRDMVYVEAQELGPIPDDATDASILSDAVLDELGVTAAEIGRWAHTRRGRTIASG